MPGTTPRGYDYPFYGEMQDFPAQIQALATDIDADVQSLYTANTTARNAPTAVVSNLSQTIPTGVQTTITFTDELYDNAGMVNIAGAPTVVTITSTGLYLVSGTIQFIGPNPTSAVCALFLRSVGGVVPDIATVTKGLGSPNTNLNMVALTRCNSGETITMAVQQNVGAPVDVQNGRLYVTKVAP
ncbi:hypothetical protein ABZ621_37515 [Streptomyces sp. NPDC007863]|uniref:hypothetical protein n=1 Tax=Streptomyces sp. NPDC007863 TaxID=3154894 RepID=UPI00340850FC